MELRPLDLPAAEATLPWLTTLAESNLAAATDALHRLRAATDAGAAEVLDLWEEIEAALGGIGAVASLMGEVHPDKAVRDAAEQIEQQVDAFATDLGLDTEVYAVLAGLDADGLDAEATRLLDKVLRDYRRSGVDRDEATRERLRELARLELETGQSFSRTIREDTRSIRVTPEQLAGLPEDWLADRPADDEGLITVTTDYPDAVPVRTFATDRGVRVELSTASNNRAWPQNDAVLRRLLELRAEHAQLLGYATWADYDTETKMIGNGTAVAEFIDRITELAGPSAQRDKQVLLKRAQADDPQVSDIDTADIAFYSEVVRREDFDVDGQQVRRYFDFTAVRQGLLDVTARLFGLTWTPVEVNVWHPEVTSYDVHLDGELLGRIHLDLHPREGKFKHAAQFTLVSGVAGQRLPEGVLVCNFGRGLMEHDEVVTLFHEFGHLIHHVLAGRQDWTRFSGVATEWDFVEAPSQMLEEWAWNPSVLETFARDASGNPIPADLVERMRAAEEFGKGFQARTQMFYAALSLDLHRSIPQDITERSLELQRHYSVFAPLPDSHFHCAFGHLNGYGTAYYTYMWSLVIAKDLYSAFDPADPFAAEVATRYRDRVLAPGGSGDAADLVEDFLGREYTFDSYADWLAKPATS
ncbi:M3 family metallopeptidase [Dermacoccaceae bacterium W4C1]